MNKVVFIKWFGVIGHWGKEEVQMQQIYRRLLRLVDEFETGRITYDDYRQMVGQLSGKSPEEVRQVIMDRIYVNQPVVEFIAKVQTNYPIVVLSGANIRFLKEVIQSKGLVHIFNWVITNPGLETRHNPIIFNKVMEIMRCHKALFIGPSQVLVNDFKQTTGQYGIVFTGSVSELEEEFRAIIDSGF